MLSTVDRHARHRPSPLMSVAGVNMDHQGNRQAGDITDRSHRVSTCERAVSARKMQSMLMIFDHELSESLGCPEGSLWQNYNDVVRGGEGVVRQRGYFGVRFERVGRPG